MLYKYLGNMYFYISNDLNPKVYKPEKKTGKINIGGRALHQWKTWKKQRSVLSKAPMVHL